LSFSTQGMCMFVIRPNTQHDEIIGWDVGYYAPNGVWVGLTRFRPTYQSDEAKQQAVNLPAFLDAVRMVSALNGGDTSIVPDLSCPKYPTLIDTWGDWGAEIRPDGLCDFGEVPR